MKYARFCFFLILLTFSMSGVSQAGHIYGTIKSGRSNVSGAIVVIECGGRIFQSKRTDHYGSYSLNVRTTGDCQLKVIINNTSSLPFRAYSSQKPLRYDFELLNDRRGQLYLKRR